MRRVTPREGCYISGHFMPGNTIVCYDLYSGGRSSTLFSRPNEFLPERYLADCLDEFKSDKRKA
jgi:cytochrome P450